jgi:hypothetical protein
LEPDRVWESVISDSALYFCARSLNMSNLQNKNREKITQFPTMFFEGPIFFFKIL